MEKTIKARFLNGVIKPLEELRLEEGKELMITISEVPSEPSKTLEALRKSFGGWKGLIDAEELKRNIYNLKLLTNNVSHFERLLLPPFIAVSLERK